MPDIQQPVAMSPAGRLLSALIRLWQWLFSSWMAPTCRFVPSCSDYALQALQSHGLVRGGWLAVRRLARCHPFGGSGLDEVPENPGTAAGRRVLRPTCRCSGVGQSTNS